MKGMLSYKEFGGTIKDVDVKNRVVTGYLSTFGNIDHHKDIMEKGAFVKSLNERRNEIFFLNQHDWSQPHGKFAVLNEDAKGLYFESDPLIDVSYSNDAIKLYDAGILTEHSVGFITVKEDYDHDTNIRTLKEVKLFEGSNVTVGANSGAKFTGLKGLTLNQINDKIDRIVKFIKNGDITDDGFMLLELSLKELQKHSFELGKKHFKEDIEPFNDTQGELLKPYTNTINEYLKSF